MRISFLLLFTAILATGQTAVIPTENATTGGNSSVNYPFSGYPSTGQYIYAESLVLGSGIKPGDIITGIQLRMKTDAPGGPPTAFTYANWDVTISKSTRAVGMLTGFIPGNQANDAVPARRGKLVLPENSMPSGKLVNNFGIFVPFTANYTYTGGDLLVTFSHDSGEWGSSNQIDGISDATKVQAISVLRYNTANGDQNNPIAPILQLTYTRPAAGPTTSAAGIVNAASYGGGAVAPGEIVAIYGEKLGQPAVVSAAVTGGRFATVAGASRVYFDGVPAPMIYSSDKQLAAVVPYSTAGKTSTQVVVESGGVKGPPVTVPVVSTIPGIFTSNASGKGQAAVLNEDGSLNSLANPAAAGSIVVIYLTGEGQTTPPGDDGALAIGATLPKPVLPVTVTAGDASATVLYAGAAPGLVAGLMQINARLNPLTPPSGATSLIVKIGDKESPKGVTISVR